MLPAAPCPKCAGDSYISTVLPGHSRRLYDLVEWNPGSCSFQRPWARASPALKHLASALASRPGSGDVRLWSCWLDEDLGSWEPLPLALALQAQSMHKVLKTVGLMGSPVSQKPRCSSSFQLHSREQQLRLIRDCPSRPRRRSSLGLQDCIADLLQPFGEDPIDLVAGIDAMGFILGAAIASTLPKGFLAIRKAGHLCVETCTQPYTDYSARQKLLEMRTDAIQPGLRVLLVDQWIETGGTMRAAIQLVEQQGGVIAGIAAICIEDSEGGTWIQEHYKCSQCVPQHLMPQFNRHQLESFQAFGATPDQA
ncbi:hypothetical protein KIL84_000333 [Mauremys mutica]|uniref:adenine phosphoribosyltransferase n=1 Tax=Mauremys mutica TaxID=74926 RepID=A0A9D3XFN5_9SAUR|nr:hypothetical protein KIL84_000333 [Mauremys mutica]